VSQIYAFVIPFPSSHFFCFFCFALDKNILIVTYRILISHNGVNIDSFYSPNDCTPNSHICIVQIKYAILLLVVAEPLLSMIGK
jgi:hypothetical protein